MHTANIERSENYSSSGCLPEVKNNGKSLNFQAYKRWSFTRGSKCIKALTGKVLVFWIAIGGRLWEVVAHGGSTVIIL